MNDTICHDDIEMSTVSLTSATACHKFLSTQPPEAVATCLRKDQLCCRNGLQPSILVYYLPPAHTTQADDISTSLFPEIVGLHRARALKQLRYSGLIQGIKAHLAQMDHEMPEINSAKASKAPDPGHPYQGSSGGLGVDGDTSAAPDSADLHTTMNVLGHLRINNMISEAAAYPEIVNAVGALLLFKQSENDATRVTRHTKHKPRKCYICQFVAPQPHHLHPALCRPCGEFNLCEVERSLPKNLNLRGKTAVVTGGRVNLGFHTALRLLRCGANVIVSTRYPRDAEYRYREQSDSDQWLGRLKLVGADFRRAKNVFDLVETIKTILQEWCGKNVESSIASLDILINNAAQTLTDPISAEILAILNEVKLQQRLGNTSCVVDNGYEVTIRGGSRTIGGLLQAEVATDSDSKKPYHSYTSQKTQATEELGIAKDQSLMSKSHKSSWVQSLTEIPYDDLITAHSVNTFVPLILIREFLPLMGHLYPGESTRNNQSPGHIINVSSREGIFESSPSSSEKAGHHVHTNMSNAGLNMITETEAATAWKSRRVAMNTVDPGYMSAAPEMRDRVECPIGFDDGAGRVLWPIALAEDDGPVLWGRFLKHFGRTKVDVGLGR